ncbi:MAG: hypothetical protein ACRC9Q_07285 [Bacteroidales bacterium]
MRNKKKSKFVIAEQYLSLEFNFEGTEKIYYLIYHTKSENGNLGAVKIYTQTEDNKEFSLQGEYNFRMQNATSRVGISQTFILLKYRHPLILTM